MSLLCVLSASPRTSAEAALLSRRMLSMRPCADALLVLCDLLAGRYGTDVFLKEAL